MASYRELIVWQKSMDLAEQIYLISSLFPKNEQYGLVSQIRRAVISIPSKIAEGHGRETGGDFNRFLAVANGSLREVETLILLAVKLNYVTNDTCEPVLNLCTEIAKMIYKLKMTLRY
jgi:four helix bundle protein